ncbi:MAG: alpha/beta hydrolase [Planctomycetes bacterium]|nr:alpha/beta hydrolase [Planctomycetota bacterium]
MKILTDIPCSRDHTDRRLIDLYLPDGAPNGAAVLLIHGGGFRGGHKGQWNGVPAWLCDRGYVVASAEYRLAPRWRFPAWIEDARLAMATLRARAGELGFDPGRIATGGSSAGGYLALILAMIGPDDELGRTGELADPDTRANAVIAWCPATTLRKDPVGFPRTPWPDLMPAAEADAPELYRSACLTERVTGAEPPILFLHGTADMTVPHRQSVDLAERLTAAGARAEVELLDGVGHGFGYGTETDAQKRALTRAEAFLAEHLRG